MFSLVPPPLPPSSRTDTLLMFLEGCGEKKASSSGGGVEPKIQRDLRRLICNFEVKCRILKTNPAIWIGGSNLIVGNGIDNVGHSDQKDPLWQSGS